jgi:hypothetical protein
LIEFSDIPGINRFDNGFLNMPLRLVLSMTFLLKRETLASLFWSWSRGLARRTSPAVHHSWSEEVSFFWKIFTGELFPIFMACVSFLFTLGSAERFIFSQKLAHFVQVFQLY